jgi:hypothetical protein
MGQYSFEDPNITADSVAIGDRASSYSQRATVTAIKAAPVLTATRDAGNELDRQGLADLGQQLRELADALEAHLARPVDPAEVVQTTKELSHTIVKEPSKARALVDRLSEEMRTAATFLGSIEALRQALTHVLK